MCDPKSQDIDAASPLGARAADKQLRVVGSEWKYWQAMGTPNHHELFTLKSGWTPERCSGFSGWGWEQPSCRDEDANLGPSEKHTVSSSSYKVSALPWAEWPETETKMNRTGTPTARRHRLGWCRSGDSQKLLQQQQKILGRENGLRNKGFRIWSWSKGPGWGWVSADSELNAEKQISGYVEISFLSL